MVGGDQELDVLELQLLVLGEGDAGGQVAVAVEVDRLDPEVPDIPHLVLRRQLNAVLGVGLSLLP